MPFFIFRGEEEIKRFAERLRADKGVNLQVRVGANAGEVVVRSIQTGQHAEYAPIGHSTGLASRLQTLAAPGSIAISERLRKLIEGYFIRLTSTAVPRVAPTGRTVLSCTGSIPPARPRSRSVFILLLMNPPQKILKEEY